MTIKYRNNLKNKFKFFCMDKGVTHGITLPILFILLF